MTTDLVNTSHRYSDPCLLDRVDRDDSEQVENEKYLVSKFRSSESSVQEVTNKQFPQFSEVLSRSVESCLTDHLQEEKHKLISDIKHVFSEFDGLWIPKHVNGNITFVPFMLQPTEKRQPCSWPNRSPSLLLPMCKEIVEEKIRLSSLQKESGKDNQNYSSMTS